MNNDLNCTQNLVHSDWEMVDPTPNIHVLFPIFDNKFFQNKLACVTLEWSKKMYSCAGICYQRSTRYGKSCIIRLSEPLLKLRARKDLVETLLHEMIHAYCFVLGFREGNGGHGPNFLKIMHGINRIAGTNISVYHTFHDEVNEYKTHWWQCDGPCRTRKPFYGLVKRTANRAPGQNDRWWYDHQNTCSGKFIKIKEPEPKRKGGKNKENFISKTPQKSIKNFFTPTSGAKKPFADPTAMNPGGKTLVVRKPPVTKKKNISQEKRPPTNEKTKNVGGNLKNVFQFKDIPGSDDDGDSPKKINKKDVPLFTGSGFSLGGGRGFAGQPGSSRNSRLLDQFPAPKRPEKRRLSSSNDESSMLLDDDDVILGTINIEEAEKKDRESREKENKIRQDLIKKEILESFSDDDMEEIILIDDEYDDDYVGDAATLTDASVIDELFKENDDLIEDFNRTNADVKTEDHHEDIVSCPMCITKMKRKFITAHVENCFSKLLGEEFKEPEPQPSTSRAYNNPPPAPPNKKAKMDSQEREVAAQLLKDCGYTSSDIQNCLKEIEPAEENVANITPEAQLLEVDAIDLTVEECECPICCRLVRFDQINAHLDACLG